MLLFVAFGSDVLLLDSLFEERELDFESDDVEELDPPEAESAAKSRPEVL